MGAYHHSFKLKTKTEVFPNDYENLVPTSEKTTPIFIIHTSLLILFKEVVAIASEIRKEQTKSGQHAEILNVAAGGSYIFATGISTVNPLKKKHMLFYLKTQFVSRSKHFSSSL